MEKVAALLLAVAVAVPAPLHAQAIMAVPPSPAATAVPPEAVAVPTGAVLPVVALDADISFPPLKPEIVARARWLTREAHCANVTEAALGNANIEDDEEPRVRIAVHHTEGQVTDEELALSEADAFTRAKELLCGIRGWHMGRVTRRTVWKGRGRRKRKVTVTRRIGRGWDDIAYHYLIDWRGRIYEGRKIEKIGSHVAHNNPGTIGVALMGDFTEQSPTEAQRKALKQLLAHLVMEFKIAPGSIRGHGDFTSSDCPGHLMSRKGEDREAYAAATASPLRRMRHELEELWARVPGRRSEHEWRGLGDAMDLAAVNFDSGL